MRILVTDPSTFFAYPEYRFEGWLLYFVYLMSQVLFSSFQFKFAQYYTWVMKNIAKHKKIAKYILHSIQSCSDRKPGERGGSVVECRIPEREIGGSKPTATVLCP